MIKSSKVNLNYYAVAAHAQFALTTTRASSEKMSSPTRLLSNRRPTPLPNQYAPYATVDLVTKPKMAQDYEEWLDNERPNTKSTYIYWPHLQRMPRRPAKVKGKRERERSQNSSCKEIVIYIDTVALRLS